MKKDETRFTIRFNPADPRHQTAMNALKSAGRRKSTLIADALCEYLIRHGSGGLAEAPQLFVPPPILAMNTVATSEGESFNQMPTVEVDEIKINTSDNQDFDDDMRDAVLGGLSAFSA